MTLNTTTTEKVGYVGAWDGRTQKRVGRSAGNRQASRRIGWRGIGRGMHLTHCPTLGEKLPHAVAARAAYKLYLLLVATIVVLYRRAVL